MIAVSVIGKNEKEMVEQIREAEKKKADLIEIRFDYLENVEEKNIKELIKFCKQAKNKIISTIRAKREGGLYKGDEERRINLLIYAAKNGSDFVDIEFSTDKNLIKKLIEESLGSRIILSYHNTKETPSLSDLKEIVNEMTKIEGISVLKIVTKARTFDDNKKILELLKYIKHKGKRVVCFCMGNLGKDSRILSLPFGAYFTFASLKKGFESAEGQIEIEELRDIYKGLSVILKWKDISYMQ